jgi:hypothetical protein
VDRVVIRKLGLLEVGFSRFPLGIVAVEAVIFVELLLGIVQVGLSIRDLDFSVIHLFLILIGIHLTGFRQ